MIISVANFSGIADEEVQAAIRAINRQIVEDYEPYWSMGARLRLEGKAGRQPTPQSPAEMRGDAIIYLWDKADVPDALGYHEANNRGIPFGFIFTELSKKIGEAWSVTLSHEALELIGDANANQLAAGPHPDPKQKGRFVFHWYEMCDAVQAETYKIDGVAVSNFVLPLYFTPGEQVGGRNDFLGTGLRSFGINPGGYVGFFDPEKQDMVTFSADEKARSRLEAKSRMGLTRRSARYRGLVAPAGTRRTVLVPDVVYHPTRATAQRRAMTASALGGFRGVLVRVRDIQVLDNHSNRLFGGDAAADVYPIVMVVSDGGQGAYEIAHLPVFNGIFDGDFLPIAGHLDVGRFGRMPSFIDVHLLLMRSNERQRDIAKAIDDALQSDDGKAAVVALNALVTAANPIAGAAVGIARDILQVVTRVLSNEKDEQIFYGVGSFAKDPDNLGIGIAHPFTDQRNARATIEIVWQSHVAAVSGNGKVAAKARVAGAAARTAARPRA